MKFRFLDENESIPDSICMNCKRTFVTSYGFHVCYCLKEWLCNSCGNQPIFIDKYFCGKIRVLNEHRNKE